LIKSNFKQALKMKNIFLNRLRYAITARGRYGTHSPFIYGFVEQVLRNKVKISDDKVFNILYRILNYIRPGKVIMTAALYDRIRQQPAFDAFNIQIFHPDKLSTDALCVFDIAELSAITVTGIAGVAENKILVYNIRKNKDMAAKWSQLSAIGRFTYSIDCFSFGLLLNDKTFRQRQHFILK
jgi:hypothetical protein